EPHLTRPLFVLGLICRVATAEQHCAAIAGGTQELVEVDAEVRLRVIQERMRHAARRTRIWAWGWGNFYATATVVSAILAAVQNPDDRIDDYVNGISALIGVVTLAFMPR